MLPRRALPALAGALLLTAVPAAASAAEPVVSLPTVVKTLRAATTPGTSCASSLTGATAAGARYTAPISGYLTATLRGAGDWDLALRTVGGRRVGASQGTTGVELVKTWITAGQTVVAVPCKRPGATGTAKVSFDLLDIAPKKQVGPTQLIKVRVNRDQLAGLERAGFDVTHDVTSGTANVLVNGTSQIKALARTGLTQQVVVADVAAKDRRDRIKDRNATLAARRRATGSRAAGLPSGRTEYRTYESIQAELKDLVDKNPTLVRSISIGKSFEDRDVNGIEIASDVKGTDGRPVFFLMGVHHAREWPAAEAAMEYAQMLVRSKDDPAIKQLLETERVVIVPLVNPDGYVVSRNAISPGDQLGGDENITLAESVAPPGGFGAYRRKNCDPVAGPATTCEAAIGVDNNRNYGNLWGGSGGSPDVTSQSFHGLSPRSEPETQNVWNFARTHHVTMLVTLHTVAALVLRPPGLAQLGLAPDEVRMKQIGDAMGAASGYDSQFSWQLYDTAGTTEDDTYAATGGYGYTIEMGPKDGAFHGDYKTNVIDQWDGTYAPAKGNGGLAKALTIAATAAATPADHALFTGSAPAGKVLRLKKEFDTVTSAYCQVGIEPVVDPVALIDPSLPPTQACPGQVQDPITLKDSVNFTTTVPSDGKFEWHIGQSTRPFVGGGATLFTFTDLPPIKTVTDGPGTPGSAEFAIPFTVPANASSVSIDLSSTNPADQWGLKLERKNADGSKTEIESHNYVDSVGEQIVLNPATAGDYVVTASNVAALTAFTVKITGKTATSKITTGKTEAYTLTCEDPSGTVLETRRLTIGRGQEVVAKLGCGAGPSVVSEAGPQGKTTLPAAGGGGGTTPGGTATGGTTGSKTTDGRPFSSSVAIDFTSLARARRQGIRVRMRANGAYSAVITLYDAKGKALRRQTLPKLTGRRTVRIKTPAIAKVRKVTVKITELATKKAKTYTLRKTLKRAPAAKKQAGAGRPA